MSLPRLLMNLLLVLALVASGPLPVFAADAAQPASSAAPCHDLDGPPPAHDGGDPDCCGDAPGYCGCDCLHPVAAAPLRLHRAMHPEPASLQVTPADAALPLSPALPDTRPPIA